MNPQFWDVVVSCQYWYQNMCMWTDVGNISGPECLYVGILFIVWCLNLATSMQFYPRERKYGDWCKDVYNYWRTINREILWVLYEGDSLKSGEDCQKTFVKFFYRHHKYGKSHQYAFLWVLQLCISRKYSENHHHDFHFSMTWNPSSWLLARRVVSRGLDTRDYKRTPKTQVKDH